MHEQWRLHCTSQWGCYILLSEHVYCAAIALKMTEQVEQQICIKFCVKLEHSYMETIQMIQKDSAMCNWWLAASSWQCAHSCIMFHAEIFGETSDYPGVFPPLQPRLGSLWFLALPKTKFMFGREEISDHRWDSGKYCGAADGDWKNCVRSQGVYFEGDQSIIVLCTMFVVSCIFFNKSLFFILHGWISSGQTLYTYMCVCVYYKLVCN